jgi:glycosyltransferase involved in cell wall biosynthesis
MSDAAGRRDDAVPDLVVVTPYGPEAATTRARATEWAAHCGLRAELHDYVGRRTNRPGDLLRRPADVWHAERDLRRLAHGRPRRLLMLREASPFDRGRLAARLLRAADRGVYDLDDALYADHRRLPDPGAVFPKPLTASRAAAVADVVLAGSEVIADWASGVARDVVVVPTCVEPADYPVKRDYRLGEAPRLCWIGTPSQERQLLEVAEPLLEVHRRTGARLLLLSAGAAELGRLGRMVDRREWTPAFARILPTCDVGIAPLRDDPFSRGKCAYKVLQYAAAGLPVAGSPVGANAAALRRFDGVAVPTAHDWVDALTALVAESDTRRATRGATARAEVERHYSFDAWAPVWRRTVLG